jgi:hypothetical protein
MAKVKVGLKNLSREEIADKLNTVRTAMTGNHDFRLAVSTTLVVGCL